MNQDQFAPRDLCERLQKTGCKSESGFYWFEIQSCVLSPSVWEVRFGKKERPDFWTGSRYVPAFVQNDFTGATGRADENCMIVWPTKRQYKRPSLLDLGCDLIIPVWEARKLEMIRCHQMGRKELWHQYLERTMGVKIPTKNTVQT